MKLLTVLMVAVAAPVVIMVLRVARSAMVAGVPVAAWAAVRRVHRHRRVVVILTMIFLSRTGHF